MRILDVVHDNIQHFISRYNCRCNRHVLQIGHRFSGFGIFYCKLCRRTWIATRIFYSTLYYCEWSPTMRIHLAKATDTAELDDPINDPIRIYVDAHWPQTQSVAILKRHLMSGPQHKPILDYMTRHIT